MTKSTFNLQLELAESYVYGHAVGDNDKSYRMNIQVGNQSIVFPGNFEMDTDQVLISFDMGKKTITLNANVIKGSSDMIELYVNDEIMQNLANDLPISMTLMTMQ